MNFLKNMFNRSDDRAEVRPLYAAIIAEARKPEWYEQGSVADSIDGRFDMVSAILALVLIRMESLRDDAHAPSSLLTELFVSDMDDQLRELGIGDIVVGKHIGKMMGALGGRLGAYRDVFEGKAVLKEVLMRNLYRGDAPSPDALIFVEQLLRDRHAQLGQASLTDLRAGKLSCA